MSTIPQRIASAFAVLCGRYGDVTQLAREREQSRQALYREAEQVVDAVDGTAAQVRIDDLQRQLAEQHAQVQALQERLKHAVEITPDKQDEFATVAQAEGVSLSVARRLLHVVAGSNSTPSVPTLGRVTLEAGEHAGQLLQVLDEKARPKVEQAAADEIFWPQTGPDAGRTREPVLAHGADSEGTRRRHVGRGIRALPGVDRRGPR
jgi:hypothetical protein